MTRFTGTMIFIAHLLIEYLLWLFSSNQDENNHRSDESHRVMGNGHKSGLWPRSELPSSHQPQWLLYQFLEHLHQFSPIRSVDGAVVERACCAHDRSDRKGVIDDIGALFTCTYG